MTGPQGILKTASTSWSRVSVGKQERFPCQTLDPSKAQSFMGAPWASGAAWPLDLEHCNVASGAGWHGGLEHWNHLLQNTHQHGLVVPERSGLHEGMMDSRGPGAPGLDLPSLDFRCLSLLQGLTLALVPCRTRQCGCRQDEAL